MDDVISTGEYLDIDPEETRWSPPPEVTTHSGNIIDAEADFFADPPEEIGELVSADSTLKLRTRPWRTASRIALAGLVGWVAAVGLDVLVANNNPADLSLFRVLEAGLFAVMALLVCYFTGFKHTCSYVGKLGVARIRCKGNRERRQPPEIFLFEDADELRTSQTRHYSHGVYTGTNYLFTWTNADGVKCFKLSGMYRGENTPPKPKDPFHFATMAEGAWSAYLFDRLVAELQSNQSVRFNLSGRNFIAVGPGFLDILVSGTEPIRLTAEEIGGIQFDAGTVKIMHIDAKEGWFSSTGVYKFSYDQMANSRLFLLLYSRLIGK